MKTFRVFLMLPMVLLAAASTAWAINLNESFSYTNFPPVGWQTQQTAQGVNIWDRSTTNTNSAPGAARSAYETTGIGEASERWLISPRLSVTGAGDQLAFWVRTLYSFVSDDDSLFVLLSTTNSNPASFTTSLGRYKCGSGGDFSNTYTQYTHSLSGYVGQQIYIAFVHRDPDDDGNTVYLDDVTGPTLLEAPNPPSLPQPADGAVAIEPDTVLHWTNGEGTDSVDVYLAVTADSVTNLLTAARRVHNQLVTLYNPGGLAANTSYYWRVVTKNQYGSTVGDVWSFTVAGAALSGSYDIGGGANHYANFTEAAAALASNGVAGAVTFNVYGGDYDERVEFGPISGASAVNTVTFLDASGTARIVHSADIGVSDGIVTLDSCSYLIFDGIDILASGVTRKCMTIRNQSTNNIFRNAHYRAAGSDIGSSIVYAVYMYLELNNSNTFDNLRLSHARYGMYFSGTSTAGLQSTGNVIQNCAIENVWNGVYASYQHNLHIRDCDIQLNGAGNTGSAWGLETSSMASGNTVHFYRNEVHNIVTGGGTSGSGMLRTSSSGGTARVYNNFCHDFQVTGSGQVRAAYCSAGDVEFYNNSIRLNDVASSGSNYLFYIASSTGAKRLRNNIFYNGDATNTSYGIYATIASYAPAELDYNAYYSAGAWTIYYAGSANQYTSLAALQAATAYEDFGVEGDPGFIGATNLHISETSGLVSNNGFVIAYVTDDIDGDPRSVTPDIGADEYNFLAPSNDFAVLEIINPLALYPELTPVTITARVQNRGSTTQSNVPVRLLFNNLEVDELLLTLAAEEVDTFDFAWTTPAAPASGNLEVQSFLPGDADPTNDSAFVSVTIVGQPMAGSYDLGGGANHYATFSAAAIDLGLRGVGGAVTFNVYPNTYSESVTIPVINGASAVNTVAFQPAAALTPPEIVGGATVVNLDGADYVTFDGIDLQATSNGSVVLLTNDADNNTFRNLSVTGNSVAGTSNNGIYFSGGGNDNNLIENVTVSGTYYGVRLAGTTSARDAGNMVRNSAITEGKYGVYLTYQAGAQIYGCDIQPGWNGAATEIYGVYATSHAASDTSWIYRNQIHNLRSTSTVNGIYSGTSSGVLVAHNNFVYDYQGPTGSSVLYGLRTASGTAAWYFNSVLIGDVATTGNIYGFYITGTSSVANLQNNVFELDEPVEDCWAIYVSSGTISSNYNAFYSSGPGALYYVGRLASVDYPTLAAWNGGTGYDGNSVEGNPGFVSALDLHIAPTFNLLDGAGTAVTGITVDIDGETRGTPPDIGADEYNYISLAHDYGVNRFIGLAANYVTQVPVTISAEVENFGSSNETNIPVRLYYNNVQQQELLVSLNAGVRDTVDFTWTPPVTEFQIGTLKAKAFVPGDGYADNDSAAAQVTVVGGPMSGIYDLGGGAMHYANFTQAVTALTLRGIDGEVIFDCYDGTYTENIEIPAIAGASFVDRITFRVHESPLTDVVTLTASAGTEVVYLNGADYITFDGVDITATGACNVCVNIANDADYNTFKNLRVTSRDSTSTSTRGIKIAFNGNDNCLVENVTVRGAFYGIRCEGGSGQSDYLEVKLCDVSGASYCVYLDDAHNARVHDNDLQPHGYSSTSTYGVYVATLTAGDTAYVYNNRIHNLRHASTSATPTVAGVWSGSNSVCYVYNNFIWDWQSNGPDVYGVYASTGQSYVYFNTIRMNDLAGADNFAGIYQGSGTLTIHNNIIVVEESANTCYGIWRSSGTLNTSDYNCLYGTGAGFRTGRDGTAEYTTLGDWQTTGRDVQSVAGDPGFVSGGDLHIDPVNTLVNNIGLYLPEVTTDIDGDVRNNPPDLGADEYIALIAPDPVTNLTVAVDPAAGNAILRWSATGGASSYKIYAGNVFDFEIGPASFVAATGSTSYTHVGALAHPDRFRYYVVLASTDAPPGPALRGFADPHNHR